MPSYRKLRIPRPRAIVKRQPRTGAALGHTWHDATAMLVVDSVRPPRRKGPPIYGPGTNDRGGLRRREAAVKAIETVDPCRACLVIPLKFARANRASARQ